MLGRFFEQSLACFVLIIFSISNSSIAFNVEFEEDKLYLNTTSSGLNFDPIKRVEPTAPFVIWVKDLGGDGVRVENDVIVVEVKFSDIVTVSEAGIFLNINSGEEAFYARGSGSDKIEFEYVVEDGDKSPLLDYVDEQSLYGNFSYTGSELIDLSLAPAGTNGSISYFNTIIVDAKKPHPLGNDPIFFNENPFEFILTMNEPVTGFDQTDIQITGATILDFESINALDYRIEITTSSSTTELILAGGAFNDLAGNPSLPYDLDLIYDTNPPQIELLGEVLQNSNPFPIVVSSDEPIGNFVPANLIFSNCGLLGHQSGPGPEKWTIILGVLSEGSATLTVPENTIFDHAGNGNEELVLELELDETPPTFTFETDVSDPTSETEIEFDIQFDETIGSFNSSNLTTINSEITNFSESSEIPDAFDIEIEVDGVEGPVGFQVHGVKDLAGNEITPIDITVEFFIPNLEILSAELDSDTPGATKEFTNQIEFVFSENINPINPQSFEISNGILTGINITNNKALVTIESGAEGDVICHLKPLGVSDIFGVFNQQGLSTSFEIDTTRPTISTEGLSNTNEIDTDVILVSNEEIEEINESNFLATNAVIVEIDQTDNYTIKVSLENINEGHVELGYSGAIEDYVGNFNLSDPFQYYYDITEPEILIGEVSQISDSEFKYELIFSEDIQSIGNGDITLNNANLIVVTETAGDKYEILIAPIEDGSFSVSLEFEDLAGNDNSAEFENEYDSTEPKLKSSQFDGLVSEISTELSFTFSEEVEFDQSKLLITNGIISTIEIDGSEVLVTIVHIEEGEVSLLFENGSYSDLAGNFGEEFEINYEFDNEPPVIEESEFTAITNSNQSVLSFHFSEPVFNDSTDPVLVEGGELSTYELSPEGTQLDLIISNTDEGTISIQLLGFVDDAGNELETNDILYVYDGTHPSLTSEQASFTNNRLEIVRVSVTEDFEFEEELITAENAIISSIEQEGLELVIQLEILDDGEVSLLLQSGSVFDVAGNVCGELLIQFVFDGTAPEIVSSEVSAFTNESGNSLEIQFSEDIGDLSTDFLICQNCNIREIEKVGENLYVIEYEIINEGLAFVKPSTINIQDPAGNFLASFEFQTVYDITNPVPVISFQQFNDQQLEEFIVEIEVSENVSITENAVLNLENLSIISQDFVDSRILELTVRLDDFGAASVEVPQGYFVDAANNFSGPATQNFIVTGLEEGLTRNRVLVAPNPSSGIFTIEADQPSLYRVTDLSGRIITQKVDRIVDLSNYKNGTYLLMIENSVTRLIKK